MNFPDSVPEPPHLPIRTLREVVSVVCDSSLENEVQSWQEANPIVQSSKVMLIELDNASQNIWHILLDFYLHST